MLDLQEFTANVSYYIYIYIYITIVRVACFVNPCKNGGRCTSKRIEETINSELDTGWISDLTDKIDNEICTCNYDYTGFYCDGN